MKESILKPSVVQNGADSVAVVREKGIVHRVDPIPIIQEIKLYNIQKNKTKIFKLDDHLMKDYQVLGVLADIPTDDGDPSKETKNPGQQKTIQVGLRIFQGRKSVDNRQFFLGIFSISTTGLFINHRDVWHMKADDNITSITLMCKHVYMEQPIVLP